MLADDIQTNKQKWVFFKTRSEYRSMEKKGRA